MRELCILCRIRSPIKNSHVVPKFVVKRLKAGNPLGTLAHSNKPREVFQDGWKGDYLCKECEKIFCLWEDWTCKNVYDPFLKTRKINVDYDERFGLFAASLCFRYIQQAVDEKPQTQITPVFKAIFENLRENLLVKNFSGILSHLYVQFLEPITSPGQFPPGVNTYFFECIDGAYFRYIVPLVGGGVGVTWMVYVKLPGCFFLLSGYDLRNIFHPASTIDSHAIRAVGNFDSCSQSGVLTELVSDNIIEGSTKIQEHYVKIPAKRLARNMDKISSLPNKQQYRAHNSFILDNTLLANWPKNKKS